MDIDLLDQSVGQVLCGEVVPDYDHHGEGPEAGGQVQDMQIVMGVHLLRLLLLILHKLQQTLSFLVGRGPAEEEEPAAHPGERLVRPGVGAHPRLGKGLHLLPPPRLREEL